MLFRKFASISRSFIRTLDTLPKILQEEMVSKKEDSGKKDKTQEARPREFNLKAPKDEDLVLHMENAPSQFAIHNDPKPVSLSRL